MPSLKDVKLQITGVGKTKQITRAMGMVASAKLRGAQNRIERFRPYAEKFHEILDDIAGRTQDAAHPLLQAHAHPQKAVVILVTSDRGLCGGFNANLVAAALELARDRRDAGLEISFICVGRKGRDAVRKTSFEILHYYGDVMGSFGFSLAAGLGRTAAELYEKAIAIDPKNADYHLNYAILLVNDKKDYVKGREELEKVVELDPYNVRAKDALDRLIKKKFKDGKPKKGLFSRKQ